jgi:bilirubin oxidase
MARSLFFINALLMSSVAADQFKWLSPVYNHFFEFPLPISPVKQPIFTANSKETGLPIDYYEVDIKPLFAKPYPELPANRMVGYDGLAPGPTFHMTQNREAIVRFINHGDRANSVHLHGSFSRAPFDGWLVSHISTTPNSIASV